MTAPPWQKISIVTPSFNQSRFLGETIDSVLGQGYPDLEYIIIDGGSSDGSVDLIRSYDDRLTYWVSEQDSGQAEAINKGWQRSNGEILGWINSDDYLLPDALRKVAIVFRGHPHVGIVYGQGVYVDEDGGKLQYTGGQIIPQKMVDGSYYSLPQPAVFLRRAVIEKVGLLDESFHYALDGEFFCRAFANFEAFYIPAPLACLRVHGVSKSVAAGKEFAPEIMRMAEKIVASPEAYPRCQVDRDTVVSGAYLNSARFLYNNGLYMSAAVSLARSVKLTRFHARQVILREFPRLLVRLIFGPQIYSRLSAYKNSGPEYGMRPTDGKPN